MITGTYTLNADPNWKTLPLQEVRLECDTTAAPVIINLFAIADLLGFYNVKVFIVDKTNNAATHNITINAGSTDKIDGASSVVINQNGGATEIQVVSANQLISFESIVAPPAAVSVLENFVLVDSIFGNDITAVPNNIAKPYATIDAAIAVAGIGNLIIVNPGTYPVFANVLQKSLSYNFLAGAAVSFNGANSASLAGESYSFFGEGDLTLNSNLSFIGAFNGRVVIDLNSVIINNYIYYDNGLYYAAPTGPLQMLFRAKSVVCNAILGMLYPGILELTIDFENYVGNVNSGLPNFWNAGSGVYTFNVNSYININHATFNPTGGTSASCGFNVSLGQPSNTTIITGNFEYNNPTAVTGRADIIFVDTSPQTVIFKGIANILNGCVVSNGGAGAAKVRIEGKVYNSDTSGVVDNSFVSYNVGSIILEIAADTIMNSANNPVVQIGGGEVDILNCEIVNTNGAAIAGTVNITAGILRIQNGKVINAVASITAPAPTTIQAYSCYTNTAPVNVTSAFVALPIVTDPAMTSNLF